MPYRLLFLSSLFILYSTNFLYAEVKRYGVIYPEGVTTHHHDHLLLIIAVIIVLFLLFAIYRQLSLLRAHKLKQQNNIADLEDMSVVINNMPILYMQVKVMCTPEDHKCLELICTKLNAYSASIGLSHDEVIGKSLSYIDQSLNDAIVNIVNDNFREKKEAAFTFYFKKIDKYFQIKMNSCYRYGVINIFFVDNTELNNMYNELAESNNQLSLALDFADLILWQVNMDHVVHIFDSYKIQTRYGKKYIDKGYVSEYCDDAIERINKEDLPLFKGEMNKLLDGTINKMRVEVRLTRIIDGESMERWRELISIVDQYDENNKPKSVMGLSIDIEDRKRNELELINAKNRAEESNRLKSAFLANMSHEIRTPLNAIIGFSQVLASVTNDEDRQSYIDIIEKNNELLLQLIDDVLDLSKIEAGVIEFNNSKVNIRDLLYEAAAITRSKNNNPYVDIIFDGNTPTIYVTTDYNRVMQIVTNLLNNALKFTDSGHIMLGYKKKDNNLYVFVEDTGIGIPEDKLGDVFERFTKLNNFKQGTGLGLSICRTLVQKLGGTIDVSSAEGKGAKFWFTLPLK